LCLVIDLEDKKRENRCKTKNKNTSYFYFKIKFHYPYIQTTFYFVKTNYLLKFLYFYI